MQRIAAFSENAGAKAEHLDFQLLWKNGISSRSLGFSAKFQAAIELSLDVTQRQDVAQRDVAQRSLPAEPPDADLPRELRAVPRRGHVGGLALPLARWQSCEPAAPAIIRILHSETIFS